jgi:ribosomal protein L24E
MIPLCAGSVTNPGNGTIVVNSDGTITYTPNPDFEGVDNFTYKACDDNGNESDPIPVTINVNAKPIGNPDIGNTNPNTPVTVPVLDNDSDPNNDPLTVCAGSVTNPGNGTIVVNSDGTITYTPNPDFEGVDTFTYKACDDNGNESDPIPVTINVNKLQAIVTTIKKDKQGDQSLNSVVAYQVDTFNPNTVALSQVVTTINLDGSKLVLDTSSVKEGVLSNISFLDILTGNIVTLAQTPNTTITILSPTTIQVTYTNMNAGETRSITFLTTTKALGEALVTTDAVITGTDITSRAQVIVPIKELLPAILVRTGSAINYGIGLSVVVALIIPLLVWMKKRSK